MFDRVLNTPLFYICGCRIRESIKIKEGIGRAWIEIKTGQGFSCKYHLEGMLININLKSGKVLKACI